MIGKEDEYGGYGYASIRLFGFTSTSLDQNVAMKFAWENTNTGHKKVLFHIKWDDDIGHYYLNAGAYDSEKEVLLYDGAKLFVHSVEDVFDQNQKKLYTKIVLGSKPEY